MKLQIFIIFFKFFSNFDVFEIFGLNQEYLVMIKSFYTKPLIKFSQNALYCYICDLGISNTISLSHGPPCSSQTTYYQGS